MNISDISNKIDQIKNNFLEDSNSFKDLSLLEIKYLGRKSEFSNLLKSLKDLTLEERKEAGMKANRLKEEITQKISELKTIGSDEDLQMIDVTAPGKKYEVGHLHLTTQAIREITDIFKRIGFYRVRYPEVEWDWYAFTSLNFPEDHPARDDWETFFIDEIVTNPKLGKRILTPHTSSGQVREMQKGRLPIRMINISKCPRRQLDISHTLIHHQFEGLVIDKDITIANLKGVLNYFVKEFFGEDRRVRIRPYDFRFTEPSFEVDVSCGKCGGEGCRLCKHGWLEIGGAGMVHPKVLEAGGIDPKVYSGFAFGWGVERNKIMQKGINIPDIRIMYQNDIRFLKQF